MIYDRISIYSALYVLPFKDTLQKPHGVVLQFKFCSQNTYQLWKTAQHCVILYIIYTAFLNPDICQRWFTQYIGEGSTVSGAS